MMASERNSGVLDVDDPWDGDGFYRYRRFKVRNPGQKGNRPRRRTIRAKEAAIFRRELTTNQH